MLTCKVFQQYYSDELCAHCMGGLVKYIYIFHYTIRYTYMYSNIYVYMYGTIFASTSIVILLFLRYYYSHSVGIIHIRAMLNIFSIHNTRMTAISTPIKFVRYVCLGKLLRKKHAIVRVRVRVRVRYEEILVCC